MRTKYNVLWTMNSICRDFYSFFKSPNPSNVISKCCSFVLLVAFLFFANTDSALAQDDAGASAEAAAGLAGDVGKGGALFKSNCSSCHETGTTKSVGPGLKDIHKRREFSWLVKWIRNSQSMVAAGDADAVKIYNEFNKIPMTSFPTLSEGDIQDIIAYIDDANNQAATASVAGGAVAAGAAASDGPSTLFVVLLVVLVVVVLLLSVVLLVVLNVLSKTVNPDADQQKSDSSSFGALAGRAARHPAVLSAAAWVFLLLVIKTSLDGAFSVGVQQGYAPKQPIAFSHKLHAGQYEIDCNYCHTGVNKSRAATIPAANICMNCHGVVKKESPEIQKIYASIENNQPIEWVRVHNLPDLAYFNHSQHVNVGGVECETCHGDVKSMEVVEQRSSLTMGWCIDCHRTTDVNSKGNAYYDKLVQAHGEEGKGVLKVADIGGLECSKCHY